MNNKILSLPALALVALAPKADAATTIAFADKGTAQTLNGVSYSTGTVSSAYYNDNQGVRHTASWVAAWEDETLIRRLCASTHPVKVYPLADNQDSTKRVVPAYDQLLGMTETVQVYPWNDFPEYGYSSKTWEIDSYLWWNPTKLPIFSRGRYAAQGYPTTQASAFNVIATDDPVSAAILAADVRDALIAKGMSSPTASMIRAAMVGANENITGWKTADRIAYAQGSTVSYAIRTTGNGPLVVSLAWMDTGSWSYMWGGSTDLTIDLDVTVSSIANGVSQKWNLNNHTRTAEELRLENAPAGIYVITISGHNVAEPSTAGGAAALSVRGNFAANADWEQVTTHKLTINRNGVYEVRDVIGGYPITLTEEAYRYDYSYDGVAFARYPLLGFTGTGDVPATGTDNTLEVTLTQDSSITWNWSNEVSDFRMRFFTIVDDWDITERKLMLDSWYPAYTMWEFELPRDFPYGWGEEYTGDFSYLDENGITTIKTLTLRCPGIEYGYTEGEEGPEFGDMLLDENGNIATSGEFPVFSGYDFIFRYYPIDFALNAPPLPDWWLFKYLYNEWYMGSGGEAEDDPDGDGFSNWEEYLCGTSPVDAAEVPVLSIDELNFENGKLAFSVADNENFAYFIEASDDLSADGWTELQNVQTSKVDGKLFFSPIASGTHKFYRVRVRAKYPEEE